MTTNTFAVITLTLKKGSGSGNYTTSSTGYVDVDATNLAYTVTIPIGWKLAIWASASVFSGTAIANIGLSLFDSSTIVEAEAEPVAINNAANISTPPWVINGDGASHTIKLQFKTTVGADAANIFNSSATLLPTMVFLLTPSN